MSQSATSINIKLIDSLAQIIFSLTDNERQLLAQKVQYPPLSNEERQRNLEALQRELEIGAEQLRNGFYTEYDDSSLPSLLETIKLRGKRGAIETIPSGKTRITIRLDDDVLEWFREKVHISGGGNYQTLINDALRQYIQFQSHEPLEDILRRVLREELKNELNFAKVNFSTESLE
jgi:uncharacterized protein (DUF4415 family)